MMPVPPQALSPPVRAHLLQPHLALRMGPSNPGASSGATGDWDRAVTSGRRPSARPGKPASSSRSPSGRSAPPRARPGRSAPSSEDPALGTQLVSLWEDALSAHLAALSPSWPSSGSSVVDQFTPWGVKSPFSRFLHIRAQPFDLGKRRCGEQTPLHEGRRRPKCPSPRTAGHATRRSPAHACAFSRAATCHTHAHASPFSALGSWCEGGDGAPHTASLPPDSTAGGLAAPQTAGGGSEDRCPPPCPRATGCERRARSVGGRPRLEPSAGDIGKTDRHIHAQRGLTCRGGSGDGPATQG